MAPGTSWTPGDCNTEKKVSDERVGGWDREVCHFGRTMNKVSLVPRPHPLARRNGLVNQIEFLGLAGALATV